MILYEKEVTNFVMSIILCMITFSESYTLDWNETS